MSDTTKVQALIESFAELSGLALTTVSGKCSGSGATYKRMQNGRTVTGARLQKMVKWLRANWQPEWPEVEWPESFDLSESKLEALLLAQLREAGLPEPEQQFQFALGRRYRADFAWPDKWLLVEIEGGMWSGGRHAIALHETSRQRRRCYAQLLGWWIIEVGPQDVKSGVACALIKCCLNSAGCARHFLDMMDAGDDVEAVL